jgi:hypothetical protein
MIAITPPKIFSKGGSPKQATPLPRQNLPHHQKSFHAKLDQAAVNRVKAERIDSG